jgi:chromosome segregation protein
MKLDYIEVCGFRGFRNAEKFNFGAGFTVISGRNGVGKSTVCDAIEFALTGEIGKYSVESAAKESVKDYIWWRGDHAPDSYYVRAAFTGVEGEQFIITRTREGGADKSEDEIAAALCQGAIPEDPLRQLAKTSILRDEWIAALSLDLTETKRFDLVSAALGATEDRELAAKAKAVVAATEERVKRAERSYEDARLSLSGALTDLSEATSLAEQSRDVTAAMRLLHSIVEAQSGEEIAAQIYQAKRQLRDRRQRLSAMGEAIFQGREIEAWRAEYDNPGATIERAELASKREKAGFDLDEAKSALERTTERFDIESRGSAIAKSLSALVENGERLGTDAGHCPLCAAARSDLEYEAGLSLARERIEKLAEGVNAEWRTLDAAWQNDTNKLDNLRRREEAHVEIFEQHGLPINLIHDLDALEREMSVENDLLFQIEQAINTLEGSQAVGKLASLDSRVATLRKHLEDAADELADVQAADAAAKSLMKSVRRSASEIVDERLALISPLLNELYQRLRPHADWRNIEYSIRGDVRRFLSLKVGDDLNPQFVFSSGQRRAAGLAFLLSVHLARSWSRWATLVLDDPVQHVDDFRALHLVEVLAALRHSGRQIICAVEDEALADLLCRRLLCTHDQPGRHYKIDVDGGASGDIVSMVEILPMSMNVIRRPETSAQAN